jgi:hypothetical protein
MLNALLRADDEHPSSQKVAEPNDDGSRTVPLLLDPPPSDEFRIFRTRLARRFRLASDREKVTGSRSPDG